MARHILQGERPIFFYGQAYLGSLDAFIIAIFFKIFGDSIFIIRLVQVLLYICTIITTVLFTEMITGSFRAAIFCGLLMTIPNVNSTLYTTVSLGGYGEALLIGNLIFLVTFKIFRLNDSSVIEERNVIWGFLLGFWGGLGFWVHAITLLYFVSSGIWLFHHIVFGKRLSKRKEICELFFSAVVGFFIGIIPIILYIRQNDLGIFLGELSGSAVAYDQRSYLLQVVSHLINLVLFGLPVIMGLRPPWAIEWLAFPIAPLVMLIWGYVCVVYIQRIKMLKKGFPRFFWVFIIFIFLLCLSFLFTSFGVDPSGRYFLPLTIILAILGGSIVDNVLPDKLWSYGLIAITIICNIWGTLQCAFNTFPGITTQFDITTAIDHRYDRELIDFLRGSGEQYGYTTYWVAYPLIFQSNEELIFIPRLPYHNDFRYTSRDDRYSLYTSAVHDADKVAYIIANNPPLTEYLRQEFYKLDL